ncbi:MAG: hypothetical protein V5789_12700 [Colwellia sp.]
MINKKRTSTESFPSDYHIVYADELLALIKVTSRAAFDYFSKNDGWYEDVTNYNEPEQPLESTPDIFIANTEDGDVFVCDFHNKRYLLNNEPFSFYKWLQSYPQMISCLIDVGLKHHVLALELHNEGSISDKAYEDAVEEPCVFYESERLSTCPQARKAILTLAPDFITYILDSATDNEKSLVVQIDGETLCYFEETASKQQREMALKQAPHIIHRLLSRTHLEVIRALTSHNSEAEFVKLANKQQRLSLIEEYPEVIEILYSTSTKKERSSAINEDGTVIRFFEAVSQEERTQALKQTSHAILYLNDVTKQERLIAIAQNPFIIGNLSDITFDEITLAFHSTCEDGYALKEIPFKKRINTMNSLDDEPVISQQHFINAITPERMPKRVFYNGNDEDYALIFQF